MQDVPVLKSIQNFCKSSSSGLCNYINKKSIKGMLEQHDTNTLQFPLSIYKMLIIFYNTHQGVVNDDTDFFRNLTSVVSKNALMHGYEKTLCTIKQKRVTFINRLEPNVAKIKAGHVGILIQK